MWAEKELLFKDLCARLPYHVKVKVWLKDGTTDVKRRVGCMCCPLQSTKKRKEEFRKHPNMVKLYLKALGKYRATHPSCKSVSIHNDEYEQFCHDVFFPGSREWNRHKDELFHQEVDYKSFLEGYFNIKL